MRNEEMENGLATRKLMEMRRRVLCIELLGKIDKMECEGKVGKGEKG